MCQWGDWVLGGTGLLVRLGAQAPRLPASRWFQGIVAKGYGGGTEPLNHRERRPALETVATKLQRLPRGSPARRFALPNPKPKAKRRSPAHPLIGLSLAFREPREKPSGETCLVRTCAGIASSRPTASRTSALPGTPRGRRHGCGSPDNEAGRRSLDQHGQQTNRSANTRPC